MGTPLLYISFCKQNCPLKEKCTFFVQSNSSSFNSFSVVFVIISFSLSIRPNITSILKYSGTLVNKEDTLLLPLDNFLYLLVFISPFTWRCLVQSQFTHTFYCAIYAVFTCCYWLWMIQCHIIALAIILMTYPW